MNACQVIGCTRDAAAILKITLLDGDGGSERRLCSRHLARFTQLLETPDRKATA